MALSITFQKSSKEKYLYSDLSLDLQRATIPSGLSNSLRSSGSDDFKTDYDENAIANSLVNLFSTRPKQRILDPEYGLDLRQFLFEPANEYTARFIARKINKTIEVFEPRIQLKFINVKVNPEDNLYDISMNVYIPSLDKNVNYDAVINENGFTI